MGRPELPTRAAAPEKELGRTDNGNIIVGGPKAAALSSQQPLLPGQISGGGILGAPNYLPTGQVSSSIAYPGQVSGGFTYPGQVSGGIAYPGVNTTQVFPGSSQYSQYGLIQGGYAQAQGGYTQVQGGAYAQGGIQTVIQGGIEYQQIPVERVEYQTVPIKVTDYQQVAVPIQNVQTYQTPVMRESYQAGGYFEYVPFERSYYEQVPVERVEYVPVEKRYTDYYAIEKQYEYIPNVSYENYREFVPQQKTEYVAQTKVEYVPQVSTEMVPVDRVQERVDYQTVEKTLVHYPQVERQFVIDAESSGRIRRDLAGTVVQPTAGGVVNRGGVIGGTTYGGNAIQGGLVGGLQGGLVGGLQGGLVGGPASLPPPSFGGSAYQGGFVGGPAALPPAPAALPAGQVYTQPGFGGFAQGGFPQGAFPQGAFTQGGFTQGGFTQGGFTQGGFPQGGFTQGGFPQGGIVQQGYGQAGLVQPGQSFVGGFPPAGYQKTGGFSGPLLGGNLAVSQPLGQPVAGGLINTGAKEGVGLRKGSLADRLANQLKQ